MIFHYFVSSRNIITRTKLHLHLLQNPPSPLLDIRFISSTISEHNPAVDFLINSCGLSPESALKASQQICFKIPSTRPDSVISLFNTYGFTQPHISKLVTKNPTVLYTDPDKILKPKLDFFTSIGISGLSLGKLVSSAPTILGRNLENQIIPSINFVRSFVHSDSSVALVLNRSRWVLHDAESKMGPNIAILRDHGVPEVNISKFILTKPQSLYCESGRFNKIVLMIKEMGGSSSSMMFLHSLHVLVAMKKSLWDAKLALYKSFGFREDDVLCMFKKQPFTMSISTKKISSSLEFLMSSLKWTAGDIVMNPTVVLLSLEKRVIPRIFVFQTLLSEGLIDKISIGWGLKLAEKLFLEKFVVKYHHNLPKLFEMYQSKMSSQGS